jgi:alginate O-acetyltransferase complex protein AlgI
VPQSIAGSQLNVPSLEFLLFAAVAALAFHLSSAQPWRQGVLLVANIAFFSTFVPHDLFAVLPYAGFLLLGYFGLHRASNQAGRWAIVAAIVLSFFWLKKYTFVPDALLLPIPYVTIGLSYVFFRILHLAIDAQQQEATSPPRPISYLNYALNFTSLVSGPIQRYEDYQRVENDAAPVDSASFGQSLERIVVGFFKVLVLSAALSSWQQQLLETIHQGDEFSSRLLYGAAIVAIYPVYLYFNFSGYTDFVIGVASWFGLVLPENFNRPFQSESFIIFWNRWHITLSSWLRTYVYQPLLLILIEKIPSRKFEPALSAFAMFVTFFLVGAWHGQTTTFLFYGVLQGFGISTNAIYQTVMGKWLGKAQYRTLRENSLYRNCARGLTFTWFSFTLLWFWSDWGKIGEISAQLGAGVAILIWPILFVGWTVVLGGWVLLFDRACTIGQSWGQVLTSRYARTMWCTALATIAIGTMLLLNSASPPIVYKNF